MAKVEFHLGNMGKFLLRYLSTLSSNTRFDSRLLHKQLGKEARKPHYEPYDDAKDPSDYAYEWLHFTGAYACDLKELGAFDQETSTTNECYMMLNPTQASLVIIFDALEGDILYQSILFETLLGTLENFRKAFPPDRYAHPWGPELGILLAVHMDQIQNKTKEELAYKPTEIAQIKPGLPKWEDTAEKKLERAFGKCLEAQGVQVQYQVSCKNGRADIVTPDAIYEVKAYLDRESLFSAIGQVLAYRAAINPVAKAVIVGQQGRWRPERLNEIAQDVGVEVIVWQDGEPVSI